MFVWWWMVFFVSGLVFLFAAFAFMATVMRRPRPAPTPPGTQFLTVGRVRLHYRDTRPGTDDAVVLLHGNLVTMEDWTASRAVEALGDRRVIVFDRPGFGRSERPHRAFGATQQAKLLLEAAAMLGVRRAVLVGQSWGVLVAIATALEAPEKVSGLVLVSGAYYPERRRDAAMVAPLASPIFGPILRHTVARQSMIARLPAAAKAMFRPREVPERFWSEMPTELFSRPEHLRAVAEDGAGMAGDQTRLSRRYGDLACPIAVIVGDADAVVDPERHSVRFARERGATLDVLPAVGHMAHWANPELVARRVATVDSRVSVAG